MHHPIHCCSPDRRTCPNGGNDFCVNFGARFIRILAKGLVFHLCLLLLWAWAASAVAFAARAPCRIQVVETGSGWPVPLVELRTLHNIRLLTDNDGVVAFDLPELMGVETWFTVLADGYEVPKDGFGYRGVRLKPEPGGSLTVKVTRTMLARCLGRLTGGGLFAESQKLGEDLDWKESGVLGCDSVQNAVYRGRLFWLWGDTTLPGYPLGIYDSSSATTLPQPLPSFEPPVRIQYQYFTDTKGKPRGVAPIQGEGPTWLTAYVTLPDQAGRPHLVATYNKIKAPLEAYEIGLCSWNDHTEEFERLRVLWSRSSGSPKPPFPDGHPAFWRDPQGRDWVLFGNPLPKLRCPPTFEAWQDASTWEPLEPQATISTDHGTGKVKPHTGSIAWNGFRKRWVTVFMEARGKPSAFGEIWYAEAPAPTGPWGHAVKILSHENYTFYNPRIHPEFTPADSPILIFEGTYTREFADHAPETPRYDYNQILYRLDLDDPRLTGAETAPKTP